MAIINYTGIDEAVLIHALYQGSHALGMGFLQECPGLTVEDVQKELETVYNRPALGLPHLDHANKQGTKLDFDYYHGHPFKLTLDTETKTFDGRLFDRDQGEGRAQAIVDGLRSK